MPEFAGQPGLFQHHKPVDKEIIARFKHTKILVIHDAHGLHKAIDEVPELNTTYYGLPDQFCVWYGTIHDIRKMIGLDPAAIRKLVQDKLSAWVFLSVEQICTEKLCSTRIKKF